MERGFCMHRGPAGAGLPAKQLARCMAPASRMFAADPTPT
ncbi:hypothetical protein PRJ_0586 [Pseudomonas sp. XWY-1]|nr:hypothetical protein PRJ_0586 [Pseudomonas sp. XWY-1]